MTNNDGGPFRAPDTVLRLEQQLRDKSEECEDLRAQVNDLKERLAEHKQEDPQVLRERSNNRTLAICVIAFAGFLAWGVFNWRQCEVEEHKGACREVLLSLTSGEKTCPYAGQIATEVAGRIKCTCPTVPVGPPTPAVSK